MTFAKGNLGFFLAFLLIGGILGSALGTLVVRLVPALQVINTGLTGPISLNLEIISFGVRLNLSAIAGMVVGVLIFRKV
jgi:archaellum component FlaG (FlaF/FlaG flagellin family)